ncbi:MAG: hypothetical protein ACI8S6_002209 [Myxococcota bacterium]|jgi:hypothetical protein
MADLSPTDRAQQFLVAPAIAAVVGDRFWFVLTDMPGVEPPLLMSPLDDEPTMPRLIALVTGFGLPPGAPLIQGKAKVAFDGAIEFEGPELEATMLGAFADYVVANAEAEPELERFVGARFMRIGRGHKTPLAACIEAPGGWGGLSRPPVPGTMPETIARLSLLESGQRAWFWMTDDGPGGLPFLLLSLADEDPDCLLFKQEVSALRTRAPESQTAAGVLLRTEHLLTFTSTQPTPHWGALMQDLMDTWAPVHPELISLAAGPLTYLSDGAITGFEETGCELPETADNLLSEQRVLQHTRGSAWFWFTDADADGAARLCLDDDQERLAARLDGQATGTVVEGEVQIDDAGRLRLRTTGDAAWLTGALTSWLETHRRTWPILSRLGGAAVLQRDNDGSTVARYMLPNIPSAE